jgi:hypothetical protein
MLANNETRRGERLNAAAGLLRGDLRDMKRSAQHHVLTSAPRVFNDGREAVFVSRDDPCVSIRILRTGL